MASDNKKPDPKKLTAEQYIRELGRYGGKLRMKKISAERRSEIAKNAALARWTKPVGGTPPTTPTPILRGRKASASDKRGRVGILLKSRSQLRLPLSIAPAILFVFALACFSPAPLYASIPHSVVGVQGVSPEDDCMPAKATLQRVVHRKPVPYMPHAHVPEYLLCYVVETLQCGHRVTVYPQADPLIAQRRRCQECDGGELIVIDALKKPSVSVRFSNAGRKRA